MNPLAQAEYDARLEKWRKVNNAGGPRGVSAQLLRNLGCCLWRYATGANGVYQDSVRGVEPIMRR
jgi:hypothetical protein